MAFEAQPLKKVGNLGEAEPYRTECGFAAALMFLDLFHDSQHIAAENLVDIAFRIAAPQ